MKQQLVADEDVAGKPRDLGDEPGDRGNAPADGEAWQSAQCRATRTQFVYEICPSHKNIHTPA
jgi:hypothetical protein